MEAAFCQESKDDAAKWGSNDSSDHDYLCAYHQGTRRVNVGQLWDKHRTFLAALLAYLQYEGGTKNLPLPLIQGHDRMEEKDRPQNPAPHQMQQAIQPTIFSNAALPRKE